VQLQRRQRDARGQLFGLDDTTVAGQGSTFGQNRVLIPRSGTRSVCQVSVIVRANQLEQLGSHNATKVDRKRDLLIGFESALGPSVQILAARSFIAA
jgi:hypothetical protein